MSSPLANVLPALWRKRAYAAYALIGIAIGAVQAGYAAAEAGQPKLLTVALAVYAYLGIGLGLTAASNVTPPEAEPYDVDLSGDAGHSQLDTVLLVLAVVGVALILFGVSLR